MKKLLNKTSHTLLTTLLWIASLFFIVGAIGAFGKSFPAGMLTLLLGLVLLPPLWKHVSKIKPNILTRRFRVVLALILFVFAVQVTPVESQVKRETEVQSAVPIAEVQKPKPPKPTDQKEDITSIAQVNDTYVIKGTGIANQEYTLVFLDGKTSKTKTDDKGRYTADIPKDASVFGEVELTRDTNGGWLGGERTYEKGYYALTDTKPQYSNNSLKPILLGVGGSTTFEASGYYLPNTTLQLRSGNTVLSTAKVDGTGRYQFKNIALDTNYKLVSIYEKISKGWFSSEVRKLTDGKYLDTVTRQVLIELPTITKEESKTETIPFGSETINSNSLKNGETKVTQEGSNGEKTITYQVTYKGNAEVSRKVINEQLTKQPIAKVTTLGTYIAPVYTSPSYTAPSVTPSSGATAQCRDGSLSYSANRRGTCSHHGGVAVWY